MHDKLSLCCKGLAVVADDIDNAVQCHSQILWVLDEATPCCSAWYQNFIPDPLCTKESILHG